MAEIAVLLLLVGSGWVVAHLVADLAPGEALAAAIPTGTALYLSVMTVLIATHVPVGFPSVGLATTVLAALGLAVRRWPRRRLTSRQLVLGAVGATVVATVVVGVVSVGGFVAATGDSFRYLTVGGLLDHFGDMSVGHLTVLWEKRGLATGSLHGLAVGDRSLLAGLAPLVALSILAMLWCAVRRAGHAFPRPVTLLVAIGSVLLLLTVERFLFHAVYINGHLLVAAWLLLLQLQVLRVLRERSLSRGGVLLVLLVSTSVVVARPEGPVLAALVLAPAVLDRAVAVRTRQWLALSVGLPALAWPGAGLLVASVARGERPGASVVGLVAFGVAASILGLVLPVVDRLPRPRSTLLWLHGAVWAALGVAAVREPGILFYSARATWRNVFYAGGWGNSLLVVGVLLVAALVLLTWDGDRAVAFTLVTFVPTSLLLAYLRGSAYRVGPGDSLNRMLMHVLPLAILAVAVSAFGRLRRWQRPGWLTGATALALTVPVAASVVVPGPVSAAERLPPGGTFADDDGNVHEGNIEAIAAERVTLGCDPPTNGRFCPGGSVTRGQMAAFLQRSLDLPAGERDHFRDDAGSAFEPAVNAIAEAGITHGCNPPANDRFCPHGFVTRGQMAAFLERAFSVPAANQDHFVDDEGSAFEAAINAIRAARYTHGCDPPANDHYCPGRVVHRDEMASFLGRALGLEANVPPDRDLRHVFDQDWTPFADVGGVVLRHPSRRVERVGFHQSNHDGARQMDHRDTAAGPVTMESRGRGTGSRTAADVVVDPDIAVRAPVTGTVKRAGTYRLYCRYSDDYAVIEPDSHPGWEVKVLHIDRVQVERGDRVEAGVTVLAPRATVLPFRSQVDDTTADPSWPHVHLEVVDPSIPDEPGGGC